MTHPRVTGLGLGLHRDCVCRRALKGKAVPAVLQGREGARVSDSLQVLREPEALLPETPSR